MELLDQYMLLELTEYLSITDKIKCNKNDAYAIMMSSIRDNDEYVITGFKRNIRELIIYQIINASEYDMNNLFRLACSYCDVDTVKLFAKEINSMLGDGFANACMEENIEVVNYFLENHKSRMDEMVISISSITGEYVSEVYQKLIAMGARSFGYLCYGVSANIFAMMRGTGTLRYSN